MRAALYARFSTELQNEDSIKDQFRVCERAAAAAGLTIVARFEDRGISGGTAERPGYQSLLAAARSGQFEIIVAEDISRLWRNRSEYGQRSAELEDLGLNLVTCVGDDTRRDGYGLVLGIKQAIAEHARREISYRTRRGLEGLALSGKSTGGRVYGYRDGKIDPLEAGTVRSIFEWAAEGWSCAGIAKRLNDEGPGWSPPIYAPAPRGGAWGRSTISAILRNPRYTGAVIWGKTEGRASAADSRHRSRRTLPQALVTRDDPTLQIVPTELFKTVRHLTAKKLAPLARARI